MIAILCDVSMATIIWVQCSYVQSLRLSLGSFLLLFLQLSISISGAVQPLFYLVPLSKFLFSILQSECQTRPGSNQLLSVEIMLKYRSQKHLAY